MPCVTGERWGYEPRRRAVTQGFGGPGVLCWMWDHLGNAIVTTCADCTLRAHVNEALHTCHGTHLARALEEALRVYRERQDQALQALRDAHSPLARAQSAEASDSRSSSPRTPQRLN